MNPLIYQDFKIIIIKIVHLSKDAIHIHVGFFALLAMLILTKKKLHHASILLAPFLVSFMMEVLDVWGDLSIGRKANIPASLHDLINTNLIPVCLFFWAKWNNRQTLRNST